MKVYQLASAVLLVLSKANATPIKNVVSGESGIAISLDPTPCTEQPSSVEAGLDIDLLKRLAGPDFDVAADGSLTIRDDGALNKRQAKPSFMTVGKDLQDRMLSYHNASRAHHGAGRMQWSTNLAVAALRSASKCKFEHTTNNPYGENIAAGTYNNPTYYAYLWYREVDKYNFNNPGFSGATGHFTQMVWKNSKQLGCAWVTGCPGGLPNMLFCEYSPAGNVLPAANFRAQVGPEQASPPRPANPPANI